MNMMEISKEDMFSEDIPSRIIKGFPYPERFCRYCQRQLLIWKAFHLQDEIDQFKVAYICLNSECDSYDEEARDAYVRVYYSSNYAYEKLNFKLMKDPRDIVKELRKQ